MTLCILIVSLTVYIRYRCTRYKYMARKVKSVCMCVEMRMPAVAGVASVEFRASRICGVVDLGGGMLVSGQLCRST